jgi:hypothetical protein
MVDRSGGEEAIGAAEAAPRSPRARSGPADVFISYASPDGGVADAVCGALERDGLICWVAPRDVVPGEFYADAIVRAIDATKVIVLVLSKNSADSPHVLREVERGSSKRHPVVSFRIGYLHHCCRTRYFRRCAPVGRACLAHTEDPSRPWRTDPHRGRAYAGHRR